MKKNIYPDGRNKPRLRLRHFYVTNNANTQQPILLAGPFEDWWEAEDYRNRDTQYLLRYQGRGRWTIENYPEYDW